MTVLAIALVRLRGAPRGSAMRPIPRSADLEHERHDLHRSLVVDGELNRERLATGLLLRNRDRAAAGAASGQRASLERRTARVALGSRCDRDDRTVRRQLQPHGIDDESLTGARAGT